MFYLLQYLSLELLIRNQQVGGKFNLELIMLKCTNGVKYIFASVADNTGAQWVSGDGQSQVKGSLASDWSTEASLGLWLALDILSSSVIYLVMIWNQLWHYDFINIKSKKMDYILVQLSLN